MAMTYDEVYEKVNEVLQNALGVDEDEVTKDAKLEADLGAESIDYLDIQFQLEKAFDIKFDATEMSPENVLSNPEYVQDGEVTEAGQAALKERMPHLDLSDFSGSVDDLADYFTVDSIVKFVQGKLG